MNPLDLYVEEAARDDGNPGALLDKGAELYLGIEFDLLPLFPKLLIVDILFKLAQFVEILEPGIANLA